MAQAPLRKPIHEEESPQGYYDKSGRFIPAGQNEYQADNENRAPSGENTQYSRTQKAVVSYRKASEETGRSANTNRAPQQTSKIMSRLDDNVPDTSLLSTADSVLAQTKAAPISANVIAWSAWWWLWVQLPFATVHAFAFSAASYVDQQNGLIEEAGEAFTKFANLFGIDFLNWTALFIITWVIVWSVSIFCLCAGVIQYSLAGLHPLGGKGSALKVSTFLVAIIGSVVPVANMIPWIFLWVAAVFYYPK